MEIIMCKSEFMCSDSRGMSMMLWKWSMKFTIKISFFFFWQRKIVKSVEYENAGTVQYNIWSFLIWMMFQV